MIPVIFLLIIDQQRGIKLETFSKEKEIITKRLADYGIELTSHQVDLLGIFLDTLIEWNRKINLVGISDRMRIIDELILDSLIPVPHLPSEGNLVDIGSGAGFPAIIIKIARPELKIRLIEANGKKVSFLRYIIHMLKLKDIEPNNKRIENISDEIREWGCDIATSRAMTGLSDVISLSCPFLKNGGFIVGFLGKNRGQELANARDLLERYNLQIYKTANYTLPGKDSERTIVVLQKQGR
ncbi:MAG: 16S rRNA (guanine(527)-N(7))-methyltransferase RsmG [Deltaproteobacteria bacterium]|nr:16S rRNA (guanine(527)-N(7))-methyltransferase RsmG [Deltaproteobacteria bacterium]